MRKKICDDDDNDDGNEIILRRINSIIQSLALLIYLERLGKMLFQHKTKQD